MTRVGSGIIYAVIIVMWAAYFIPRWLRRHEELSETRSVEKFDQAMRILSRREATPDRRQVVMPPRPAAPRATLPARTPLPAQRGASVRPRRASRAAVRRRRVLAGLLLSTFVATVLSPLTAVPWWAPVTLLVLTLADIAHLRAQVRSSREVTRSREAVRRSMSSRLLRFDSLDRLMSVRRELAEERAAEDARWAAAEEAERRLRDQEERRAADEAGRWDPVPVPLPTYVSKPVAPRRAQPAVSTDAPSAPAATVEPTAAPRSGMSALVDDADSAEEQLGAIIERRAVND